MRNCIHYPSNNDTNTWTRSPLSLQPHHQLQSPVFAPQVQISNQKKIIVNIRIYTDHCERIAEYPLCQVSDPVPGAGADQSTLTPLAPSGPRTHARRHAGWRACDRNLPVCRTSLGVGPSTRSKNILGSNSVKDTQDTADIPSITDRGHLSLIYLLDFLRKPQHDDERHDGQRSKQTILMIVCWPILVQAQPTVRFLGSEVWK